MHRQQPTVREVLDSQKADPSDRFGFAGTAKGKPVLARDSQPAARGIKEHLNGGRTPTRLSGDPSLKQDGSSALKADRRVEALNTQLSHEQVIEVRPKTITQQAYPDELMARAGNQKPGFPSKSIHTDALRVSELREPPHKVNSPAKHHADLILQRRTSQALPSTDKINLKAEATKSSCRFNRRVERKRKLHLEKKAILCEGCR